MSRLILAALCLCHMQVFIYASGLYAIVAPGTIHSNSLYSVVLSVHNVSDPCKVKVALKGPDFEQQQEVDVSPMTLANAQFQIPNIKRGDYELVAEGVAGIIFTNSTSLNFADNQPSVFVQTDKARYKPGDLVQFRVVFLDENIRPATVKQSITISIKDADQNRLKIFKNIKLIKGVYSGNYLLSDFPVLGEWQINVELSGSPVKSKNFDVAQYILPKFEVILDTPKKVCIFNDKFAITVRAKYTFGKSVAGKATITIHPLPVAGTIGSPYSRPWGPTLNHQNFGRPGGVYLSNGYPTAPFDSGYNAQPGGFYPGGNVFPSHIASGFYPYIDNGYRSTKKTIDLNGKAYVEFDMSAVIPNGLARPSPHTVHAFVEFEDELTNSKANATATVVLVWNRFDIIAPSMDLKCGESNTTFVYSVAVTDLDGTPVTDPKHSVSLTQIIYGHTPNQKTLEAYLNKQGIANFDLKCSQESTTFSIKTTYRGEEAHARISLNNIGMNNQWQSPITLSPGLHVLTANPIIGKDIEIQVNSGGIMSAFVYVVVGRGNIICSGLIDLSGKEQRTHTFKFPSSLEMMPTSTVYVHYMSGNDFKFLETTFNLDKNFVNKLTIEAPKQTKPGQNISLHIKTDTNSFVGLIGVDQSVLLLKSGNDFQKDMILNSLNNMKTSTPYEFMQTPGQYPGGKAGVVTLTNANYPYYKPILYNDQMFYNRFTPGSGASNAGGISYSFASSMAMPASYMTRGSAMSAPPPTVPPPLQIQPRVRKDFSESWFVADFHGVENDTFNFTKTVPDTITSWIVSGFSLNPRTGFTLSENPAKIQTFRPFFITTNLPYSVKRGEVVAIPVIVFNYMDELVEAEITLDNSDADFEFSDLSGDQVKRLEHVRVPPNSAETVEFMIRPKRIGHIILKLSAVTHLAGDALNKKLKVDPEGITVFENRDFYVHAIEGQNFIEKVLLTIPENIVEDSEYIEVSLMGDILGSTITNLDQLVRMPSGCGEQNMINFVPNILVLLYLESIQQLSPSIESKAKHYLQIGYQRELTYKHTNGSYSAFGTSDKSGSTWLTAYVIRSFHQAARYIDVEPKILKDGLRFLASIQAPNGNFPEYGRVLDFAHLNDVGLTAFVLLSFLECTELNAEYGDVIKAGVRYLEENVKHIDDLYALSIAVYALQLSDSSVANDLLAKLDVDAHTDGGQKWWSKSTSDKGNGQAWRPKSHDVEVTGYILMTFLVRNEPVLPITKWLISQRNSNGGFASTQETVVGLQALIKFAEKSGTGQKNLQITFEGKGKQVSGYTSKLSVDHQNALEMQTEVLPKWIRELTLEGTGAGTAVLQVSYRYNILEKEKKPSFKLETKVKPETTATKLIMEICTQFVPQELGSSTNDPLQSNMVVMEVDLPSGYTIEAEDFDSIKSVESVKLVESKKSDTNVVVYFDGLEKLQERCVPINAYRVHNVAEQKPVPVVIYDYYDNQKRATTFYHLP